MCTAANCRTYLKVYHAHFHVRISAHRGAMWGQRAGPWNFHRIQSTVNITHLTNVSHRVSICNGPTTTMKLYVGWYVAISRVSEFDYVKIAAHIYTTLHVANDFRSKLRWHTRIAHTEHPNKRFCSGYLWDYAWDYNYRVRCLTFDRGTTVLFGVLDYTLDNDTRYTKIKLLQRAPCSLINQT